MTILHDLELIITQRGFKVEIEGWSVDSEAFHEDKYVALLRLSFHELSHHMYGDSFALHALGREFVQRLVRSPGLGEDPLHIDVPFEDVVMFALPEHRLINRTWAKNVWKWLLEAFRRDFRRFDGPLDLYFESIIHEPQSCHYIGLHLTEYCGRPILAMTHLDVVGCIHRRRMPLGLYLRMNRDNLDATDYVLDVLDRMRGCGWPLWDLVESGNILQPIEVSKDEYREIVSLVPLLESYGIECFIPYRDWSPYSTRIHMPRPTMGRSWWSDLWVEHYRKRIDDPRRLERGETIASNRDFGPIPILPGHMFCTINGSKGRQYHVDIRMDTPSEAEIHALEMRLRRDHAAMRDLMKGTLPLYLSDSLDFGDIHAECSCPDDAVMCKHIVSVLAHLGIRSRDDPSLIYRFLGVDVDRVWKESRIERLQTLLDRSRESARRLSDEETRAIWHQLERTYLCESYDL